MAEDQFKIDIGVDTQSLEKVKKEFQEMKLGGVGGSSNNTPQDENKQTNLLGVGVAKGIRLAGVTGAAIAGAGVLSTLGGAAVAGAVEVGKTIADEAPEVLDDAKDGLIDLVEDTGLLTDEQSDYINQFRDINKDVNDEQNKAKQEEKSFYEELQDATSLTKFGFVGAFAALASLATLFVDKARDIGNTLESGSNIGRNFTPINFEDTDDFVGPPRPTSSQLSSQQSGTDFINGLLR